MKIRNVAFTNFSRTLFYIIFFFSGVAGLIYESIWTHYLKLFLGHAAYAQTLVLIIFMGGLAIGSYLAGIFSKKIPSLLLGYALVEFIIGILGLFFHPVFVHTTNFIFHHILPNVHSVGSIMAWKWGVGTLLILPQAILLGMTFPLMSGGLLRRDPSISGKSLSLLYFSNSLGAALGVLICSFYLIQEIGLPGTVFVAGIINIMVALAVWVLARLSPIQEDTLVLPEKPEAQRSSLWMLLLITAAITGVSSFMYEIAWIRLLALVLGSSTHAFELMLSSFILGLALGSLFIKSRIDQLPNPLRYLGKIQIYMGLFALLSLVLYTQQFKVMAFVLGALASTGTGYILFNLASHFICLLVMLPATFCAGMTLPLITANLLRAGYGEKSIGETYAANTIGSVVGIVISIHIALILLQLKGLLILGAAIDVVLGIYLLSVNRQHRSKAILLPTMIGGLALFFCYFFINLNPMVLYSGVYRYKKPELTGEEIPFARTGKTASVSVDKSSSGLVIRTNGKPDASYSMGEVPNPDESTQTLLPILPLSIFPEAKTMAVIGFGSGISSHIALEFPKLQRVDTIEIEPMMVEGAKLFLPHNKNVYTDPRSHIHIEDAKTFFSNHPFKYDIILSEPSNPWVSGVASLFTVEFYEHIKNSLNDHGILCQWIHLYELDLVSFASVVQALEKNFLYYTLYATNLGDVLIIAGNDQEIPLPGKEVFANAKAQSYLKRIGILSLDDLNSTIQGNRTIYSPLLKSYRAPINSDYFPFLEFHAAKSRFMGNNSSNFLLAANYLPLDILTPTVPRLNPANINPRLQVPRATAASTAYMIYLTLMGKPLPPTATMDDSFHLNILTLDSQGMNCNHPLLKTALQRKLFELGVITSLLLPEDAHTFWKKAEELTCPAAATDPATKTIVKLFLSLADRDLAHTLDNSLLLLQNQNFNLPKIQVMLLSYAALTYIKNKEYEDVLRLGDHFANMLNPTETYTSSFRLLYYMSYFHK